jgi:hypothetical protein
MPRFLQPAVFTTAIFPLMHINRSKCTVFTVTHSKLHVTLFCFTFITAKLSLLILQQLHNYAACYCNFHIEQATKHVHSLHERLSSRRRAQVTMTSSATIAWEIARRCRMRPFPWIIRKQAPANIRSNWIVESRLWLRGSSATRWFPILVLRH